MHAIHPNVPGLRALTAALAASLLLLLAVVLGPPLPTLGDGGARSAADAPAVGATARPAERPVWLSDQRTAMERLAAWPDASSR